MKLATSEEQAAEGRYHCDRPGEIGGDRSDLRDQRTSGADDEDYRTGQGDQSKDRKKGDDVEPCPQLSTVSEGPGTVSVKGHGSR